MSDGEETPVPKVQRITPYNRRTEAPTDLRALPGWLCWRYEGGDVTKGIKPRKVPYWADGNRRHGKQGRPEDRERLTTFAAARDAAARLGMDGVGLAMLADWGIIGLDFDDCVGLDGEMPPEIAVIAAQTYAEYSPSGQGVRAFLVNYDLGDLKNRKATKRPGQYGFEVFIRSGFLTFTGNPLPQTEIMGKEDVVSDAPELAEHVKAMRAKRWKKNTTERGPGDSFMDGHEPRIGLADDMLVDIISALSPDMPREPWIKVGAALHHETDGGENGFDIWDEWSCDGKEYKGEGDLRRDWESFDRRTGSGQKQVTMATVIQMAQKQGYDYHKPRTTPAPAKADDLREVAAQQPPPADPSAVETPDDYEGKFVIANPAQLMLRPDIEWFIKNVLPRTELGAVFGPSGGGKSFHTLDLAFAIATGTPWRGHRTKKARVLYIAAEGSGGVSKRFRALCKHHGVDPATLDIGVITVPPNVMERDDIKELVRAAKAAGGFDLIFIDTYAQATPGANENASEDMGLALTNCRALGEAMEATVCLVHHSGKDLAKGLRGWSGFRAAMDFVHEVSRHEDGQREISIEKMKDGEDGMRFGLRLHVVDLGKDADGDPITSCVAVDAPLPTIQSKVKERKVVERFGPVERHILEIIASPEFEALQDADYALFAQKCVDTMLKPEPPLRDQRQRDVKRALDSLRKRGKIEIEHGRVIF